MEFSLAVVKVTIEIASDFVNFTTEESSVDLFSVLLPSYSLVNFSTLRQIFRAVNRTKESLSIPQKFRAAV